MGGTFQRSGRACSSLSSSWVDRGRQSCTQHFCRRVPHDTFLASSHEEARAALQVRKSLEAYMPLLGMTWLCLTRLRGAFVAT